jgi:hypothetical protein
MPLAPWVYATLIAHASHNMFWHIVCQHLSVQSRAEHLPAEQYHQNKDQKCVDHWSVGCGRRSWPVGEQAKDECENYQDPEQQTQTHKFPFVISFLTPILPEGNAYKN